MAETNPLWEADNTKPAGAPSAPSAPAGRAAPADTGPANPLWSADAETQQQRQAAPQMTPEQLRSDIGRAAVAGIGRGAVGLAGLPGDVESLIDLAREKVTGTKPGERYFPTGAEMIQKAESLHPMAKEYLGYQPVSTAAKYVRSGAEFIPGALIGPGGIGAKVAGGLGAGLAVQGAEDFAHKYQLSPGAEAGLKLGASIPAYMLGAKGVSLAAKPFEGVLTPGTAAKERLAATLGRDFATQGKYGAPAEVGSALASGAEMAPAALAGEQTKRLLSQASSKLGPEAQEGYAAMASKAAANAPENTIAHIDNMFGAPVSAYDEMQALARRMRDVNSENYQRVMALPEAQSIGGPELAAIIDRVPQNMFRKVIEDMKISGLSPEELGMIRTKGGYAINPEGMPLRFWDEVKQSIDSQINGLKDVSGKVTDTSRYNALNALNKDLKTQLNKIEPYKAIRDEAAEMFGARDWTDLGQKYFKMTGSNMDRMRDLESRLAKANPERQMDFAYGLASAYKDMLQNSKTADKALSMFSGKEGQFNIDKFLKGLAPLGENAGIDLIGRVHAENLNRNIAAIRPPSMFEKTVKSQSMPILGGGAGMLADLLLTPAIWAGKPSAIITSLAGAGLGKLYSMKEARIAHRVLELASDPSMTAELGALIAKDQAARSFLAKTNSVLSRGAKYPAAVGTSGLGEGPQQQQPAEPAQVSRPGRASGGRIQGMQTAEMLMRAAHRAKLKINKDTEQILDQPDESVVKALSIAQQHI